MASLVMLVIIVLGIGGVVWRRWRRRQAYAMPVSREAPHETFAHQAFTHGNSCLAAGQFADAIVAFHQARALEPTHPHVAGRLAEVARRQQAARATPLVNTPG
jgi:Flp pilus assembly protein TadD